MGMRTIKYYMKQPDRFEVTRLALDDEDEKDDENLMQKEMGAAFKDYLDNVAIPEDIPKLPLSLKEDIVRLSEMSTSARSSIKRKEFGFNNPIERRDLKEMPIRMAKQLKNIGRSLMIMNGGTLTELDARIIYQLALDSIPDTRKKIMEAATGSEFITIEGLTKELKLDSESLKLHIGDLVALEIIHANKTYGERFSYTLRHDYRELMSKFQQIEMTNKLLDDTEDPALPPLTQPKVEEEKAVDIMDIPTIYKDELPL